jgi:hypothetical protein
MVLLEGVSRRYLVGDNEVYALRDVDLEVENVQCGALMHPGCTSPLPSLLGPSSRS